MAISFEALKRLFPYPAKEQFLETLDGVALSSDEAKGFLRAALTDALPGTATEVTIDRWLEALGVSVPADATLADKRGAVVTAYTATGGQSLGYLEDQIHNRFPDVSITETDTFEFTLGGFYSFARDFIYLLALVQRLSPAHLQAVYNVRSVYDGDVARCRIGTVGRAICGRGETAYSAADGEVARSSVGRVGLAITGRVPA